MLIQGCITINRIIITMVFMDIVINNTKIQTFILGRSPNILLQDPDDKTLQVYTVGKVRNPGANLKCRDVEM